MVDLLIRVGSRGRSVIMPEFTIQGTSGVWTDVTPGGIDLDNSHNGGDNYGVNDVLADPTSPNVFYALVNYGGIWWSQDFGLTWTKRSTDGKLDTGKNWAGVMTSAYMLVGSGNNFTSGQLKVWRSTDGGQTFTGSANLPDEPYSFDVDPNDATHVICALHGTNGNLYESFDSGQTWASSGDMGTSFSSYVFFIDSTHILAIGSEDTGAAGTRVGTWGGASWSWVKTSTREHRHGTCQVYIDRVNNFIFHASAADVAKSVDGGANWTQVSTQYGSTVVATPTKLYAAASFPSGVGAAPRQQSATRPAGTSWTDDSAGTPAGMTNGPKTMALQTDGTRWAIVGGCWCAGIWRYIE